MGCYAWMEVILEAGPAVSQAILEEAVHEEVHVWVETQEGGIG